jgi:hypothetical protein
LNESLNKRLSVFVDQNGSQMSNEESVALKLDKENNFKIVINHSTESNEAALEIKSIICDLYSS